MMNVFIRGPWSVWRWSLERQSIRQLHSAAVAVGVPALSMRASYSPFALVFQERTISGTFYGSVRPDLDFPILVDHYMNKRLNIDGLISRTYKLDEINDGFKRMMGGEVARGVVVFD